MSGPNAMDQQRYKTKSNQRSSDARRAGQRALRLAAALIASGATMALTGCYNGPVQTVGDYLNLRNSFLDPSQVGRFDKANPFGRVKPVKWPILDQLDVDDESGNHWAGAAEPTPADLVPEMKEYTLGPGDTISVDVFELLAPGQDFSQQRRVNELGYVNLQSIGQVLVSGLTPSQLETKIAQTLVDKRVLPAAGPDSAGPQVSVQVMDSRQHVFSFLGSIARPGTYNVLAPDFRLLDAIALAGDIPVQPGMDYLYVIRQIPYTQKSMDAATGETGASVPATTGAPSGNPLGTLEQIEKGSQTEPTTAPASTPATSPKSDSGLPQFVRPLPTAEVVSDGKSLGTVAASDLDGALGVPTTAAPPATSGPGGESIPTPLPPTTTMATTSAAAVTQPMTNPADQKLLESAIAQPAANQAPRYVFLDGRWVPIPAHPPTTNPAIAVSPQGVPVPTTNEISVSGPPEKLVQQRIIRIPIAALREGVSKYNIVVRAGDIINIPPIDPGEFYLMGNIRGGVYSLTGRKITLKMAVAAAGGLGASAIPWRCDLIRRIGNDQEVTVQVNLQKIFDGEQPDIFLKPNDVLNVGTDAIAPFLLIMRNAYHFSYGFDFNYDRNLYTGAGSQGNLNVNS